MGGVSRIAQHLGPCHRAGGSVRKREGKCLAYLDRHEIADVLEATKGRLGNTVDIDELRIVEGIAADLLW